MPAWFYPVGEDRRGPFEQDEQMEESAVKARS